MKTTRENETMGARAQVVTEIAPVGALDKQIPFGYDNKKSKNKSKSKTNAEDAESAAKAYTGSLRSG